MLFHNTYGVDMGNDTIKISDRDERKFLMERNVIAIRDQTHVIAVGQKAFEMYEKTPVNVEATCPMAGGVIADTEYGNCTLEVSKEMCGVSYASSADLFCCSKQYFRSRKKGLFFYSEGKNQGKEGFFGRKRNCRCCWNGTAD